MEALVSEHTLNLSQAWLDISPNPVTNLAGVPAVKSITVALPGGGPSPIVLADKSGYFKSAGIGNVEISDIEEPLLACSRVSSTSPSSISSTRWTAPCRACPWWRSPVTGTTPPTASTAAT